MAARANDGVLQTEINHAIGDGSVLFNLVFRDADAPVAFFEPHVAAHAMVLRKVARSELHLLRGVAVPDRFKRRLAGLEIPTTIGSNSYGFVRSYTAPDPSKAIQVTAKWRCKPNAPAGSGEALASIWRQVGTDAFDLEKGLLRFEV